MLTSYFYPFCHLVPRFLFNIAKYKHSFTDNYNKLCVCNIFKKSTNQIFRKDKYLLTCIYYLFIGSTFSLTVTATYTASGSDKVYYQWQDFNKVALTSNVVLNSGNTHYSHYLYLLNAYCCELKVLQQLLLPQAAKQDIMLLSSLLDRPSLFPAETLVRPCLGVLLLLTSVELLLNLEVTLVLPSHPILYLSFLIFL